MRGNFLALAWFLTAAMAFSTAASESSRQPRPRSGQANNEPRWRIEIEIGTSRRVPSLKMQSWNRRLAELRVDRVRIRQALADDEVSISEQSLGNSSTIRIFGMLDTRGRLIVPGHAFSERDSKAIQTWLDELREFGPKGSPEGQPLWGLSKEQFVALQRALSTPAAVIEGATLTKLVEAFRAQTRIEMSIDPQVDLLLSGRTGEIAVPATAKGLSWGTWMSLVLARHGFAFEPQRTPDDTVRVHLDLSEAVADPWPLGWTTQVRLNQMAPKLFEFITFEVTNIPLATVLEQVEARVGVPILIDLPALERAGIDADRMRVSLPPKRGAWITSLRKLLFQAKLASEVRVDEAGKPFLWITPLKKPARPSTGEPGLREPQRRTP